MLGMRQTIFSTLHFQLKKRFDFLFVYFTEHYHESPTPDDLLCLPSWHHGKQRKLSWKSPGILLSDSCGNRDIYTPMWRWFHPVSCCRRSAVGWIVPRTASWSAPTRTCARSSTSCSRPQTASTSVTAALPWSPARRRYDLAQNRGGVRRFVFVNRSAVQNVNFTPDEKTRVDRTFYISTSIVIRD